jgi:REP element-mobilizing transposase RayT
MTAVYPMHPPRLHRLTCLYLKHPLYFLTLCTANRRPLVANPETHSAFMHYCQSGATLGACVGRYVLMPDHLHLFVSFSPAAPSLSSWVKSLKNTLSKHWRTTDIAAPHWQKGFFDHVLRSADLQAEKWQYVATNPVHTGLVQESSPWPHQSIVHDLRF